MKKTLLFLIASLMIFFITSCDKNTNENQDGAIKVTLLASGWINSPTDANDTYREWIKNNYGLDITLMTTSDFDSNVIIRFASNNKPDIVVFDTMASYNAIENQGVLIDDWSKYLDSMPEVKKMIYAQRTNENEMSTVEKIFTSDDKLKVLWTIPDPATWSLKIREDWATEFRNDGNADWMPNTPEDLLDFARWIKENKPGCYGFTSAGSRASFGTLGNYISYMFGYVNELPWGLYVDESGNPNFGVLDGPYERYLNYIKTIVYEELIDPQWYEQDWEHKTKTKEGKIGIEWYPVTITSETEQYQADYLPQGETTLNWWKTYNLPSDGGKYSGFMPINSYFGHIITVSKKCSLDNEKMTRICRFLNDIAFYTEGEAENKVFKRGVAYDALRWGVGVEPNLAFQDIPGTNYKYICTSTKEGEPEHYRNTSAGQGAWDWGAWFSNTGDGVIQGTSDIVDDITMKVYEHNMLTSIMAAQVQVGSSLNLDSSLVKTVQTMMENYSYKYVTGQNTGYDSYQSFVNAWKQKGGDELLADAKEQFKNLGYIK